MKKIYQVAMLVIMFGFSGLLAACNTTQVQTDQSTQDITSQEVQAIVAKVEPYLQFDVNRLLEVSDQGKRELSDKEFLFAQTSINETNKLVSGGEWKYGETPKDKVQYLDSQVKTARYSTGWNFWASNVSCSARADVTALWWGAIYLSLDDCAARELKSVLDLGAWGAAGALYKRSFPGFLVSSLMWLPAWEVGNKNNGNGVVIMQGGWSQAWRILRR